MHIRLYPDVLLHVQMYITLIFSGKDEQTAFSRIGWLWAKITSGDTCWNAALSKKLLCTRKVRDTVQQFSFPFCRALDDQQLIFFAVSVSMKIQKFCGILLMSMLHYSRDYPEYFGSFFMLYSFHDHPEILLNHLITMVWWRTKCFWQNGFLAWSHAGDEQLCREAKLAHCGALREAQVYKICLLCAYMQNPIT